MGKLSKEWIVVIGLALLFIAVKYPFLLMEAAVLIAVWMSLSKSTPKSVKEEEKDSNFTPAEETEGPECKKSDAFYSGVGESDVIYDKSAKFVTPKRPIEKSIE
jgi:hypothetical protein